MSVCVFVSVCITVYMQFIYSLLLAVSALSFAAAAAVVDVAERYIHDKGD